MRLPLVAVLILWLLLTPLLSMLPVSAAPVSGTWHDMGMIVYDTSTFTDNNPFDDLHEYARKSAPCSDKLYPIDFDNKPKTAVFADLEAGGVGQCYVVDKKGKLQPIDPEDEREKIITLSGTIVLAEPQKSKIGALRNNANVLTVYIPNECKFDWSEGVVHRMLFRRPTDKNDPDRKAHPNRFWQPAKNNKFNPLVYVEVNGKKVSIFNNTPIVGPAFPLCGEMLLSSDPPITGTGGLVDPGAGGNRTSGEDQVQCDAGPGLTWIVCTLIGWIEEVVNFVANDIIVPFLQVSPVEQKDPTTGNNSNIYDIWKSLRTLANILLVPVFIVIIYSQAIGGGGKE